MYQPRRQAARKSRGWRLSSQKHDLEFRTAGSRHVDLDCVIYGSPPWLVQESRRGGQTRLTTNVRIYLRKWTVVDERSDR